MARPPRPQAAGLVYHVGSRGVDRQPIFDVVEHDRNFFLALLDATVARCRWRVYAYCLMGNHFHLVLETPEPNLSDGMRLLKGGYARWFNDVRPREGALFERRFWSEVVATEPYALELARYVPLNPVRAGFSRTPEDWSWSSYAATVGLARAPRFLAADAVLDWFGGGAQARVRFARFVGEGMATGP